MTTPWYKRAWAWLTDKASEVWTLSVACFLSFLLLCGVAAGVVLLTAALSVYGVVVVAGAVVVAVITLVASMTAPRVKG